MAGGIGSRFWPSSREHLPKQFLDILGLGRSLLQLTVERFERIVPRANILVVTNEQYRQLVEAQLPDFAPSQILCEPSRNNTAPCIAYTAFRLHQTDKNATFVVAPSDHIILRHEAFEQKIRAALALAAENDVLLTLGIQPTHPNTGYGYIQFDEQQPLGESYKVSRFTEKPDLATATRFCQDGGYLWNAGIFVWQSRNILRALQQNAPDIYELFAKGIDHYGKTTEADFIRQYYPQSPDISIDYAVMEKAKNIYTIPADIGWSDLGTWASLYDYLPKDEAHHNAANAANILLQESSNNVVHLSRADKIAVLRGLDNFIVVDTDDALLIYPKDKEQEIKQVVRGLDKRFQ